MIALFLLSAAAAAPSRPQALPAPAPIALAAATETRLPTGLRVLVVENHALLLIAVELLIGAGQNAEPPGKAGLARLTALLMLEGSDDADAAAAKTQAFAALETTSFTADGPRESLSQILDWLGQGAAKVSTGGFERVRRQVAAESAKAEPNRLRWLNALWGPDSQWAQAPGAELNAVTARDVRTFQDTWYQPQNAVLSIAGDVSVAEVAEAVRTHFGRWVRGPRKPTRPSRFAKARSGTVTLVDWPKSTSGEIGVRGPAPSWNGPEMLPLMIAKLILGGLNESRLNRDLRDERGYGQGIRSQMFGARQSVFWSSGEIAESDNLAAAAAALRKELRRAAIVSPQEVAAAKRALLRDAASRLQTNASAASSMALLAFRGQPLTYFRTLSGELTAVDSAQVSRAARRWLAPEQLEIFVAGPRATVEPALKALHLEPARVVPAD